jgi:hypothetical protein
VARRANSMSPLSPVDGRGGSGVSKPGGGRQDNARWEGDGQCTWGDRSVRRIRGDHGPTGSPAPWFSWGLGAAWGPLALAPCRCLMQANTLTFIDIFADRNFDPGPWNHWSVAAFGASGGGPTWTHRGVHDMAGSNRSQDILPHTACGSSAAGGARWISAGRAPSRPQADGGHGRFQSQVPATVDSSLRVQRSQQRHGMVVTAPLRP